MNQKIKPNQKSTAIELYEQCMEEGLNSHQTCTIINEALGLNCTESTYRKLHAASLAARILNEEDIADHEDKLVTYTRRELRLKHQSKSLIRQRAVVDQNVRALGDKELMLSIAEKLFSAPAIATQMLMVEHPVQNGWHAFAYGDVHWGYTYQSDKIKYNKDIAAKRLDQIFQRIVQRTREAGYTDISILDAADDIEGSSLRVSQLMRIIEDMTAQAKGYADYLQSRLDWLSAQLPDVKITFYHVNRDNHAQLRLHNTSRDELDENLQILITNQLRVHIDTAHQFGGLKNLTYVAADEIVIDVNNEKLLLIHGHQYKRSDNILADAGKRHETKLHYAVIAHWHQYSHKNRDVQRGVQESIVFLPPVVGDTDYSDRLLLSGRPGFVELHITSEKYMTSRPILLDLSEE